MPRTRRAVRDIKDEMLLFLAMTLPTFPIQPDWSDEDVKEAGDLVLTHLMRSVRGPQRVA